MLRGENELVLTFNEILKNLNVVDLSHTFESWMPRPQVPYGHIPWKSYEKGDTFNTFMFLMFEHAGTHVDAPIHLGGVDGPSIEDIPLEKWMGPCCVIDMRNKKEREEVSREDIKTWEKKYGLINKNDIVLFSFGWEKNWGTSHGVENQPYMKNNPGISKDAASYLVEKKIKMVGGDIPTIDSDSNPDEPAHKILLPNHTLIMENLMNLDKLPPKGAFILALPLKIKNGTGCPVRAIAFIPKTC